MSLLDLLYPPRCVGCARSYDEPGFCPQCLGRIVPPERPGCPICGIPYRTSAGTDHPCLRCLSRPPRFGRARAAAVYRSSESERHPLASALQRYKYGRDVTMAPILARLLDERCAFGPDYDVVIPVPLHRDRLRWRGFNQSLLLARPLARRWRIPLDPFVLRRTRSTSAQVGLGEIERRRNVAGAFAVRPRPSPRGLCALLVDDVLTTGATVDECADTLLRAGMERVDVAVLARALPH